MQEAFSMPIQAASHSREKQSEYRRDSLTLDERLMGKVEVKMYRMALHSLHSSHNRTRTHLAWRKYSMISSSCEMKRRHRRFLRHLGCCSSRPCLPCQAQ